MPDEIISQEEINALLGGVENSNQVTKEETPNTEELVMEHRDILEKAPVEQNIAVKTPQFPSFSDEDVKETTGNMDVLMDVPLEVTVELGKTTKKVKEIVSFGPGTVIELDRLVGEPIDILVNGKYIANGEVVVIDENFGIRITDIVRPENRV